MSIIPNFDIDTTTESELIEQLRVRSFPFTDFSPGSPLDILISLQAYTMSELLFYVNQLPTATALEFFRLAGVIRLNGTKAKGKVFFSLNVTSTNTLTINQGYSIPFKDTEFLVTETVVCQPGSTGCWADVECAKEGSEYNVSIYGLAQVPTLLSFSYLTNPDTISGGTDLETLDRTLERARVSLTSSNVLTTSRQYQDASESFLGADYRAWIIPLLEANKTSFSQGNVHVFVWNGRTTAISELTRCQVELQSRSYIGSSTYVSNVDVAPTTLSISLSYSGISSEVLRDAIVKLLQDLLDYRVYPIGQTLTTQSIGYRVLNLSGVSEVLWVLINQQAMNKPFNIFEVPLLETVELNLLDTATQVLTPYLISLEGGDPN